MNRFLHRALTIWLFSSTLGYGKESAKPGFTMPQVSPKEDVRRRSQVVSSREESWYKPSFALGFGAGFPTLLSVEGYGFVGRYLALRGFFMPPIPFGIRVELPSDVISAKQGLAVANPPFDVNFKGRYGSSYGADIMLFPFAGSFFVGAGLSERRLRLEGNADSGILACSVIEAAKEPPCGDKNARIETQTRLAIKADLTTASMVNSLGAGWFVRFWDSAYMTFQFGYAKPWNIDRRVSVSATLDSPSSTPTEITGALADIRTEKEDEMRTKVLQEIKNYDEKGQPILGLSFGMRL
jgi:hypothetical protein